MIYIIILLSILLIGSIIIIALQRKEIMKIFFSLENTIDYINDSQELVEDFLKHLETFNEMDMYMGDPIVEDVVKHSKFVVERMKQINSSLVLETEEEKEIKKEEIE